jgi:hypothetical protein
VNGREYDEDGVEVQVERHTNALPQPIGLVWNLQVMETRVEEGEWDAEVGFPGRGNGARAHGATREEAVAAALMAFAFRIVQTRTTP